MTKLKKVFLEFVDYVPKQNETPMYLKDSSGNIHDVFYIENGEIHSHLGVFQGNETWKPVLPCVRDSVTNEIVANINGIHYIYIENGILHDHSFFYNDGVLETINILWYEEILKQGGNCYIQIDGNDIPIRIDNYLILQTSN